MGNSFDWRKFGRELLKEGEGLRNIVMDPKTFGEFFYDEVEPYREKIAKYKKQAAKYKKQATEYKKQALAWKCENQVILESIRKGIVDGLTKRYDFSNVPGVVEDKLNKLQDSKALLKVLLFFLTCPDGTCEEFLATLEEALADVPD